MSVVDSANQEETICTPIGRPSWLVLNRIDSAGIPVRLNGDVALITWKGETVTPSTTRSLRPCLVAGNGVTGHSSTSYRWKYSAKLSRRRSMVSAPFYAPMQLSAGMG